MECDFWIQVLKDIVIFVLFWKNQLLCQEDTKKLFGKVDMGKNWAIC